MADDMTDDEVDELLTLAALGELTADQEAQLQAAADADPLVARELAELLEVAAAVQRTEQETPPQQLRDLVLAAIEPEGESSPPAPVAPVIELAQRRRRRRFAALTVAAAVLAVGLIGIAVLRAPGTSSPDPIAEVAEADDAVVRALDGSLDGSLEVVHSPSLDAVVLRGSGLDPLADDQTYQAWIIEASGPTSLGTFRPDADGTVELRLDDADPTDAVVGITIEPAGGSRTPTLPVLATA